MSSATSKTDDNSKPFRVIIIGGGVAGLTTGLAVRRAGHEAVVLERTPELSILGSVLHVPPNALRSLRPFGVLADLEKQAAPMNHITLTRYQNGEVLRRMQLKPTMEEQYGLPYWGIERQYVLRCLLDAALAAGVEMQWNCVVASFDFERPAVHLESGRVVEGDLIIGADGENSQCRSLLLGHPDPPFHFGHDIFHSVIDVAEVRKHEDLRQFADDPGAPWWMGPGTMVLMTVNGQGTASQLIMNGGLIRTEGAPIHGRPIPVGRKEIHNHFPGWDPNIHKLIDLSDGGMKWTVTATTVLTDWSHKSGKFVLMGDSAHAMTPFMGQGAAQAIEDGAVLGALLAQATSASDIPEVVRVFQGLREPRCTKLKNVSLSISPTYHMPDGPEQEARDHTLKNTEPCSGYPIPWMDPEFQAWMYTYDAELEAQQAWENRKA